MTNTNWLTDPEFPGVEYSFIEDLDPRGPLLHWRTSVGQGILAISEATPEAARKAYRAKREWVRGNHVQAGYCTEENCLTDGRLCRKRKDA